jgi:hypothetical protein
MRFLSRCHDTFIMLSWQGYHDNIIIITGYHTLSWKLHTLLIFWPDHPDYTILTSGNLVILNNRTPYKAIRPDHTSNLNNPDDPDQPYHLDYPHYPDNSEHLDHPDSAEQLHHPDPTLQFNQTIPTILNNLSSWTTFQPDTLPIWTNLTMLSLLTLQTNVTFLTISHHPEPPNLNENQKKKTTYLYLNFWHHFFWRQLTLLIFRFIFIFFIFILVISVNLYRTGTMTYKL